MWCTGTISCLLSEVYLCLLLLVYGVWPQSLYRLVQVKQIKVSPPRMPLAISSRRVNIWYHPDPHAQCKRVTWTVFFLTASGCLLFIGANIVSTNYRPSTFSILFGLFPSRGGRSNFSIIFKLFPSRGKKSAPRFA